MSSAGLHLLVAKRVEVPGSGIQFHPDLAILSKWDEGKLRAGADDAAHAEWHLDSGVRK